MGLSHHVVQTFCYMPIFRTRIRFLPHLIPSESRGGEQGSRSKIALAKPIIKAPQSFALFKPPLLKGGGRRSLPEGFWPEAHIARK